MSRLEIARLISRESLLAIGRTRFLGQRSGGTPTSVMPKKGGKGPFLAVTFLLRYAQELGGGR